MSDKIKLEQYIPLLYKISSKFPYELKDELISEGYIALHTASQNFNPDKGHPFQTYAYKYVFFAMNKFVKDSWGMDTVSLDNAVCDEDGFETTHGDLLIDENDFAQDYENKDFYDKHMEELTPIERFIKQRYYEEGMSAREITELYHELIQIKDYRTIYKILKR